MSALSAMPTMRELGDGSPDAGLRSRATWLVGGAALLLLVAAAPFVGGILGAIVLAVLLYEPNTKLSARIGANRAAAVLLVACSLIIGLPALVLGHLAWSQAQSFDASTIAPTRWNSALIDELLGGRFSSILQEVATRLASVLGVIASWAAGTAARGVLDVGVMFLCLFFLLRSGDRMWQRVCIYLPFSTASSNELSVQLRRVTKATVLGTLLSAALQGTSMAVGFALTGLGMPVFWGIVTAFASMIPEVGTALVWVPAAAIMLLHHAIVGAVVIVALGWVVPSAIDKVVRALVSRRVGNIHPLTTLLGALIGIRLFGVVGLVVGPLMVAAFIELLDLYERDYGPRRAMAGEGLPASPTHVVEEVV